MNELSIQNGLFHELVAAHAVIVPNYTPNRWWENDLFAVSKAGLWIEHEIKLTLSDFKADQKKDMPIGGGKRWWKKQPMERKHDLLADRSERGPNRFYYVVPESLADKIDLPSWAGLKVAKVSNWNGRIFTTTTHKAPLLHKQKIDPKVIEHARGVCYWRFWNLRRDAETEINRRLKRIAA